MEEVACCNAPGVSISVVSHLQTGLVATLLKDLEIHCKDSSFELILTLNLDENLPFAVDGFSYPIKLIRNATPLGFGANHNQAFKQASGRYFCVMNPDIRLIGNPFNALLACFEDSSVGVVAPLVLNGDGEVEVSARRFPSPLKILCKVFGGCRGADYVIKDVPIRPDWVGGMFMLFPRGIFEQLGGFDERYFLYYEDVELCGRLRLLAYQAVLCPQAKAIHNAQRSSHRNLRYARWHVQSMARFFLSPVYRRVRSLRQS